MIISLDAKMKLTDIDLTMKTKIGMLFLLLAALIAISTALAHLSCIYLGAECYAAQMAPQQIIDSAIKGTYLAPIGTLFASATFVMMGLYALSGAGIIRQLPLTKYTIYTIATLSIIRGILPLQLWVRHPERVSDLVLTIGIVWLVAGLLYLLGYRCCANARLAH